MVFSSSGRGMRLLSVPIVAIMLTLLASIGLHWVVVGLWPSLLGTLYFVRNDLLGIVRERVEWLKREFLTPYWG